MPLESVAKSSGIVRFALKPQVLARRTTYGSFAEPGGGPGAHGSPVLAAQRLAQHISNRLSVAGVLPGEGPTGQPGLRQPLGAWTSASQHGACPSPTAPIAEQFGQGMTHRTTARDLLPSPTARESLSVFQMDLQMGFPQLIRAFMPCPCSCSSTHIGTKGKQTTWCVLPQIRPWLGHPKIHRLSPKPLEQ